MSEYTHFDGKGRPKSVGSATRAMHDGLTERSSTDGARICTHRTNISGKWEPTDGGNLQEIAASKFKAAATTDASDRSIRLTLKRAPSPTDAFQSESKRCTYVLQDTDLIPVKIARQVQEVTDLAPIDSPYLDIDTKYGPKTDAGSADGDMHYDLRIEVRPLEKPSGGITTDTETFATAREPIQKTSLGDTIDIEFALEGASEEFFGARKADNTGYFNGDWYTIAGLDMGKEMPVRIYTSADAESHMGRAQLRAEFSLSERPDPAVHGSTAAGADESKGARS